MPVDNVLASRSLAHVDGRIAASGEAAARTPIVKSMKRAKRDALLLIETFVSKSNNPRVRASLPVYTT